MKIYSAPIQGFTDCAWRNMHSAIFANGIDRYYAPFLRIERGAFRNKDLRDIDPKNNIGYYLVPQIIACPVEQFHALIEKVASLGYREIDINSKTALWCRSSVIPRSSCRNNECSKKFLRYQILSKNAPWCRKAG